MASAASIPGDLEASEVGRIVARHAAVGAREPQRVDTHAAHVFLTRDSAWKIKRPVRYDYLDFSTVELRREALERELTLNKSIAPALYVGVHPIARSGSGTVEIDGSGEVLEWILEMRRFADEDLLAVVAMERRLTAPLILEIADQIAAFHDGAEVVPGDGSERLRRVIDGNAANLMLHRNIDPGQAHELIAHQRRELARCAPSIDERAQAGRVRFGHGDLHLGNIALFEGKPLLFDRLEFSDELATVDVLYDLAFLVMDLLGAGLPDEASMLANRYVDRSPSDEDGWHLFPLFLSLRATVRAHVRAAAGQADEARAYLDLAGDMLQRAAPRLIAVGGRSGSGKSTLARALAGRVGTPPGARVLRSDVLRKRLAGVPPETRLVSESYTAEASAQVYSTMMAIGEQHLRCDVAVVLDAAFLTEVERREAAALACRASVPFVGLWLEATQASRMKRLESRGADASDATPEVVTRQSSRSTGDLEAWTTVDAAQDVDRVIAQGREACRAEHS